MLNMKGTLSEIHEALAARYGNLGLIASTRREAVSPGSEAAFFRWLPVPKLTVDGMETERRLLQLGVNVYCSYRFTVNHNPQNFMRIAISSPHTAADLEKGCMILRDFIRDNLFPDT